MRQFLYKYFIERKMSLRLFHPVQTVVQFNCKSPISKYNWKPCKSCLITYLHLKFKSNSDEYLGFPISLNLFSFMTQIFARLQRKILNLFLGNSFFSFWSFCKDCIFRLFFSTILFWMEMTFKQICDKKVLKLN